MKKQRHGLAFYGETKRLAGEKLKTVDFLIIILINSLLLLEVFNLLAESNETELLKAKPIASASVLKEQQRLHKVYHFIETNYQNNIDVNEVAEIMPPYNSSILQVF